MRAPGFHLGQATAPERLTRDRLTQQSWGDRLTAAQYLDRERTLRQTDHARLAMHTWVLRLENGVVVARCETYRLALQPGGVVEVIASVFVDRPLRGVGMASRMLELLVENRREAGIDALLLFSEVGESIYERAGFQRLPGPMRHAVARPYTVPSSVRRLTIDDLPALRDRRERWREGRIDVVLSDALLEWHRARSAFYAQALGRDDSPVIGVASDDAAVLWAVDHKAGLLRLLEASGAPGSALEPLLLAAADEAATLGLTGAELWDDDHSLTLKGGAAHEREDDLAMGLAFTPRGELFLGPLSRLSWA